VIDEGTGMRLYGHEHIDRSLATDGEEGHDWQGRTPCSSSRPAVARASSRTHPLIYGRHGDDYLVVASKGGAPNHPSGIPTSGLTLKLRYRFSISGASAHGDGGGEARALADHDEGVARLRRVPGEDGPGDPVVVLEPQ
jgi:hypothetical protein